MTGRYVKKNWARCSQPSLGDRKEQAEPYADCQKWQEEKRELRRKEANKIAPCRRCEA